MTIEQLGNLTKNRFPNNPEYQGKSDREVGEMLTMKHYAYHGGRKFDFAKKEAIVPEPTTENKYPNMPAGYNPKGVVQYDRPIGPEPAPETGATRTPLDFGVGVTKGVASSILGLISLPKKGGEALAGMIINMMGLDKSVLEQAKSIQSIKEKVEATGALKAKGTAEKFGKGLEQLAEFFIPGLAGKTKLSSEGLKIINRISKPSTVETIAKLATKPKVVETAEKLITKPKVVETVAKIVSSPKVEKLIETGSKIFSATKPVAIRSVQEGFRFGGITAIQKGEIDKDVAVSTAIGAAFPVVVFGINKVGNSLREPIQRKVWTDLLERNADEIIGNPIALKAAKLNIVVPTLEKESAKKIIQSKVEKNLENLFNKLKGLTEVSEKSIDVKLLRKTIFTKFLEVEKLKEGVRRTDPAFEVIQLFTKSNNLFKILDKSLPATKTSLTMKEAFRLQLSFMKEIERNITKTDPELVKLQVLLAKELKGTINKLMPEIKTANDKVAVLAQVQVAIERAMVSGKPASPISQADIITGLGGYSLGAGIYPILGKKALETPFVRTAASRILNLFNDLPDPAKSKFYLGIKGLVAGYVEIAVIEED